MYFQQQVYRVGLVILVRLRILVYLERVEVFELVQTLQAGFPKLGVVNLAFFDQQLTANDKVARDFVALHLDARDLELLALVDVDVKTNRFSSIVELRHWIRHKVDVAKPTELGGKIFQPFAEVSKVDVVAILGRELRA